MDKRLEGRVCLVTGAGSGIGQAIARRFAEEGARVYALDKNLSAAENTAAGIKKAGGQAEGRAFDVTDAGRVRAGIRMMADDAGSIDVLVNVAGLSLVTDSRIIDIPEETWDSVIAVNL